jgi:uncharacterized protein (TIGR01777 family)
MNARKIVIAGGSGFLGQLLAKHFMAIGWNVVVFSRRTAPANSLFRSLHWSGCTIGPWISELEGAEALVNLAGKSVNCRYHQRNRRELLDSRLNSTRVLGEAIARCVEPPRVWLNSSTATIYRHTFGPAWDERGEIGAKREAKDAFSIEIAQAWEHTFEQAPAPQTRKITLRTAMVLGFASNSVFPVLRRLVRLRLGGRMGSGKQFVSWIHEADFCRAIEWLISHEVFSGAVNICAPNPVPNQEMMRTLRRVCSVRIGLPATEWMLEAGTFVLQTETELIIKSRRVVPERLLAAGFKFRYPTIRSAFEELCRRN